MLAYNVSSSDLDVPGNDLRDSLQRVVNKNYNSLVSSHSVLLPFIYYKSRTQSTVKT